MVEAHNFIRGEGGVSHLKGASASRILYLKTIEFNILNIYDIWF